jgi:hypothetical protein
MKTLARIKKTCVVVIVIGLSLMTIGKITKQYTYSPSAFETVFTDPEAYVALHIAYLDK